MGAEWLYVYRLFTLVTALLTELWLLLPSNHGRGAHRTSLAQETIQMQNSKYGSY